MRPSRSSMRTFLGSVFLFILVACGSGGGCSSCAGCAVQPIPGGFPIANRIPNSAQMRLSASGVDFISANINPILATQFPHGLNFAIPETMGSFSAGGTINYDICTSGTGSCMVHAEIESFALTPQNGTNQVNATIHMRLDTRNAALDRSAIPLSIRGECVSSFCVIDTSCSADIDTSAGSRDYVELVAQVQLQAETRAARAGYTKIAVTSIALTSGMDIEGADLNLGDCSGVSGAILGALTSVFKTQLVSLLENALQSQLSSAVASQTCTKHGVYGCPTGTFSVPDNTATSTCRYDNNANADCVPMLLGTDGQGDLGQAFLGKISPGTHGTGQFVLAAGGDAQSVGNGLSLSFYGGYNSTNADFSVTPGHNSCVPLTTQPAIPTIPRVDAFRSNVIPGTATPADVGIGIAQDYLNYAAWGVFDSGLLCIGAGTRLSQKLTTSLVSLLLPNLKSLAFPLDNAPLAFAIRPQLAPQITIGTTSTDPLLTMLLPHVQIDFYVWSNERYLRFMTYQTDLTLTLNLTVVGSQLQPTITGLTAANSVVTNADLVSSNPASVATVVEGLLGSLAGMLTSSIPPVALPAIMGFDLTVPEGGIKGVSDSGENFLGIFANLSLAGATAHSLHIAPPDTHVSVDNLMLNREGMQLETFGKGQLPSMRLHFEAEGNNAAGYEFSYRIDDEPWSAWSRDTTVIAKNRILFYQARHSVEVRSRLADHHEIFDLTPATAEVLVDTLAPELELHATPGQLEAEGHDLVTAREGLKYRMRINHGVWSAWQSSAIFATADLKGTADVEASDEAGNVVGRQSDLIRGLPNPSAPAGGCGCAVAADPRVPSSLGLLASFAIFGVAFIRRARKSSKRLNVNVAKLVRNVLLMSMPLVLGIAGCHCSTSPTNPMADGGMVANTCNPACTGTSLCCPTTDMCVSYNPATLCPSGKVCAAMNDITLDDSCTAICSMCVTPPPLLPGLLGTYMDMAVQDDGSVVFSGYSPGVPPGLHYGDLLYGTWSTDSMSVTWQIIDGVPNVPPTGDTAGWRGGVSSPGDDVGKYSSIAVHGADTYISYYDATNQALKLAHRAGQGMPWQIQTVDHGGDCGRFSSITVTADGLPAIAYSCIGQSTMTAGKQTGTALVAVAHSGAPAASTDWDIEILQSVEMMCRPQYCSAGQSCLSTAGTCVTPTTNCSAACAAGSVCSAGTCQTTLPSPYIEDLPAATGLYASIAALPGTGLGVVFYDRSSGNLWGNSWNGSAWGSRFLVDGYANVPSHGDDGEGASLFVADDGTWHVSYVDGANENLLYATVSNGVVSLQGVVDDGSTDGSALNPDGRHIIGDDSTIAVTSDGTVRIAYQDTTAGRLMLATNNGGTWSIRALDSTDSTGYFAEQQLHADMPTIAAWYRKADMHSTNGVRVYTPN